MKLIEILLSYNRTLFFLFHVTEPKRKENNLYGIILCPLNLNGKITAKKYLVDLQKLEHDSLEKQYIRICSFHEFFIFSCCIYTGCRNEKYPSGWTNFWNKSFLFLTGVHFAHTLNPAYSVT